MSARANWTATAVGTAVGTGGWMFGVGRIFWPTHPMWAVFFLTIAATVISMVVVGRSMRSASRRTRG